MDLKEVEVIITFNLYSEANSHSHATTLESTNENKMVKKGMFLSICTYIYTHIHINNLHIIYIVKNNKKY